MNYNALYSLLKKAVTELKDECFIPSLSVQVRKLAFNSGTRIQATTQSHDLHHQKSHACFIQPDSQLDCNRNFNYLEVTYIQQAINKGYIIMLHGLNEKKWDKYLPWAYELSRRTAKTVILFPLAFHMNRAPLDWSDRRHMQEISLHRTQKITGNAESSFINAAISYRISQDPRRFFRSGLQSYRDIIRLTRVLQQKSGNGIPIDFFGYSLGGFLGLILQMSDTASLLPTSKLFLFCAGTTVDRMYPSSRHILDTDATTALQAYLFAQVQGNFEADPELRRYIRCTNEGQHFKTMICYNHERDLRDKLIARLSNRIRAVALKNDTVITPAEVANLLNSGESLKPVKMDTWQFNHPYSHENPFPVCDSHATEVNSSFAAFASTAASFFNE